MFRFISIRSAAMTPAALIFAGMLVPASAEDSVPESALQLPVPRAALQDPDATELEAAVPADSSADAVPFNPALAALGRANANLDAHLPARAPIPVDVIRNGFATRQDTMSASQDRSVGFKLGRDVFSLSTTLSDQASTGATRDARLNWRMAQPVSSGQGFIWGLATGGGSSLYSNPEQIGEALIGYRQELFPHLTLTSQLAMAGNYVFAPGDGLHTTLTPEMKLSVDVAKLADLPWQTSFDVSLARKLPLIASDYETRGRAMLSLKYQLQ